MTFFGEIDFQTKQNLGKSEFLEKNLTFLRGTDLYLKIKREKSQFGIN